MKMKTCSACKKELALTSENFHRDAKNLCGYRARCRTCSNAVKVKVEDQTAPVMPLKARHESPEKSLSTKTTIVTPKKIMREIACNEFLESKADFHAVLDEISKKHDACYTLTRQTDGICILQVHGDPKISFKPQDSRSLLEKVLA